MEIDKRLNLVMEVERYEGGSIHIHCTPISRETYKDHFELLAEAIYGLYAKGFSPPACTRMVHQKIQQLIGSNPTYKNAESTLLAEIWRLTNVIVPTAQGNEVMPFFEAMKRVDLLSEDDVDEVKNYLCFFTAASWAHGKVERRGIYELITESGLVITSSDVTAYSNSLRTSTTAATTGETAPRSFIPS